MSGRFPPKVDFKWPSKEGGNPPAGKAVACLVWRCGLLIHRPIVKLSLFANLAARRAANGQSGRREFTDFDAPPALGIGGRIGRRQCGRLDAPQRATHWRRGYNSKPSCAISSTSSS